MPKTITGVQIARTGKFSLSTGEHTFTKSELEAAVEAGKTFRPRIGIGHIDPRFNNVAATHDGDPSFGQIDNMVLRPVEGEEGEFEIIGDYVNVPDNLAAGLASHYPSRSLEGKAKDGLLKITAVKLLGMTPPGISGIKDLNKLLEGADDSVMVMACSADDGHEHIIVLDPTGKGLAASADKDKEKGPMPKETKKKDEEKDPPNGETIDFRTSLIKMLGLKDDATDEEIKKAQDDLAALNAEDDENDDNGDETDEAPTSEQIAAAIAVIEANGGKVMDADAAEALTVMASAGADVAIKHMKAETKAFVEDRAEKGVIPPAAIPGWIERIEKDPGSKDLLASFAENMIPVSERGKSDDNDNNGGGEEQLINGSATGLFDFSQGA